MEIYEIFPAISSFAIANRLIAIGIVGILLIFLWKKPWEFFKFALFVLVFVCGMYVVMQFSQSAKSGAQYKQSMTTETDEKWQKN